MDGEAAERLMNIILQMKINLVHVTATLHQQTFEVQQQLGVIFEGEKKSLQDHVDGIYDKLKECSASLEDYKKRYAALATMREKLILLGAAPSPMPAALPADQVEGVIAWRLQELKSRGKI